MLDLMKRVHWSQSAANHTFQHMGRDHDPKQWLAFLLCCLNGVFHLGMPGSGSRLEYAMAMRCSMSQLDARIYVTFCTLITRNAPFTIVIKLGLAGTTVLQATVSASSLTPKICHQGVF